MVDEKRLDEAVENLFMARMKLGVLDKKEENPFDKIPYTVVDSEEMRKLNRKRDRQKNQHHTISHQFQVQHPPLCHTPFIPSMI